MNTRIPINGCDLRVLLLRTDEYHRLTGVLCTPAEFPAPYTFEDFIREKRTTEDQLRTALSRRWTEREDFEVASDTNHAFTLCGGIYTPRIVCGDYLQTLHQVLRTTRMRDHWSYATAVELAEPIDGMTDCDFVLRGDTVYVASDLGHFDFVHHFSRRMSDVNE